MHHLTLAIYNTLIYKCKMNNKSEVVYNVPITLKPGVGARHGGVTHLLTLFRVGGGGRVNFTEWPWIKFRHSLFSIFFEPNSIYEVVYLHLNSFLYWGFEPRGRRRFWCFPIIYWFFICMQLLLSIEYKNFIFAEHWTSCLPNLFFLLLPLFCL